MLAQSRRAQCSYDNIEVVSANLTHVISLLYEEKLTAVGHLLIRVNVGTDHPIYILGFPWLS